MKTYLKYLCTACLLSSCLITVTDAHAIARRSKHMNVSPAIASVCSKIETLNPAKQFWKNNKPKRASSAITAPVVGYYKQMTLANNAGVRNGIGKSRAVLFDSDGGTLSSMTPYPCRSDHCGGRVVSSAQTDVSRRLAISRTRSPIGYVRYNRTTCMKIDDIGRCYGNEVDKSRPLCNQVVG